MTPAILLTILCIFNSACNKETAAADSRDVYVFQNPSYIPDEAVSWDALFALFRNGKCEDYNKSTTLEDSPRYHLSGAERIAAFASSSRDNLVFGKEKSGGMASEYFVRAKDPDKSIPQAIAGVHLVHADEEFSKIEVAPITAGISFRIKNAPEELQNIRISMPSTSDTYYFESEVFENNSGIDGISFDLKDKAVEYRCFPMTGLPEGGWTLDAELSFINGACSASFPVYREIKAGDEVTVSIDFGKLDSENKYTIIYEYSNKYLKDISADSKDFASYVNPDKAFVDKNIYYNVYFQKPDGSWKSAEVRNALCSDSYIKHGQIWNDWDNSKSLRDTMCFSIFENDFTGPVKIRVQRRRGGSFDKVEVRPSNYGIAVTECGDNTIEFTLPSFEKRKVSVEFDGDRQHNLFLLPNRPDPDKPTEISSDVLYYGPGEHEAGKITLRSNQTLYIDYGATVYGNVVVAGDNCTIAGNGVLSGEHLKHWGETYSNGEMLILCNPYHTPVRTNLTVKDVTMIDSPSWTLTAYNYDGITIDGINMICWTLNGDGIDIVCSKNVEIMNCMLRNYDDNITIKVHHGGQPESDTFDVHIHDNLIWNDYARGIVIGPEAGNNKFSDGCLHDILVEDCVILQNARSSGYSDLRAGIAIGQFASPDYAASWNPKGGTANPIRDITFRNIFFDSIHKSGRNIAILQNVDDPEGSTYMENITFENISVKSAAGSTLSTFLVIPNQHKIKGLHIINTTVDGKKLGVEDIGGDFFVRGTLSSVEVDFK